MLTCLAQVWIFEFGVNVAFGVLHSVVRRFNLKIVLGIFMGFKKRREPIHGGLGAASLPHTFLNPIKIPRTIFRLKRLRNYLLEVGKTPTYIQ